MVYLTPFKMRCFMYKVRLIDGMMKVTPADDKMNQTWQASFPLTTFSLPRPAFSYLHVMRNDGLHLGKTYFMGHAVLGVDLWLLWRVATKVKYCFLLCFYNNNPSLSQSSPLFIGCSFSQHVFCFQGIKAHGSATLSSRRQLSECQCCVHLTGRDCVL